MIKPHVCRKTFALLCGVAIISSCFMAEPTAIATVAMRAPMKVLSLIGCASYYSYECADRPMANGKIFDPERRTCASWFYKFGTVLIVKSLDTGRSTEVIVTDRGPNRRLVKEGRIIDLSKRAFEDIRELRYGLTQVSITVKTAKR